MSPPGAVGYPSHPVLPSIRYVQDVAPGDVRSWFEAFWKWAGDLEPRVLERLKALYPDVEFTPYYARNVDDLEDVPAKESGPRASWWSTYMAPQAWSRGSCPRASQ